MFKGDGGFAAPQALGTNSSNISVKVMSGGSKPFALSSKPVSLPLASKINDSRKPTTSVTFSMDTVDQKASAPGSIKAATVVADEEDEEEDNLMYEDGDVGDNDYDGYDDEYY